MIFSSDKFIFPASRSTHPRDVMQMYASCCSVDHLVCNDFLVGCIRNASTIFVQFASTCCLQIKYAVRKRWSRPLLDLRGPYRYSGTIKVSHVVLLHVHCLHRIHKVQKVFLSVFAGGRSHRLRSSRHVLRAASPLPLLIHFCRPAMLCY